MYFQIIFFMYLPIDMKKNPVFYVHMRQDSYKCKKRKIFIWTIFPYYKLLLFITIYKNNVSADNF